MPLYELIYFVSSRATLPTVAQCMRSKAEIVFKHGGVIRRYENMGILPLAYPMYRHREKHFKGRWVTMLFDGSNRLLSELNQHIGEDKDVFRWVFYKQKVMTMDKHDSTATEGTFTGEENVEERVQKEQQDMLRSFIRQTAYDKQEYMRKLNEANQQQEEKVTNESEKILN
ncbi:ribosomal protein S6 [Acrasis kona]|uniref:Ribosomal protein S6 n=1 Tax=Acrasis kona TaxID=1008807 RepID=A0AAW2YSF5_9EUKA